MGTLYRLVHTAFTGLVFVLAVAGSPVANSASAEATTADPIVTFCQNGTYGRIYDCACLEEHALPLRTAWSEQSMERHQSQVASAPTPAMIADWEQELQDDTLSERDKTRLRMQIHSAKRTIERLERKPPPEPMAMPLPTLFNQLAREGVCRKGDQLSADRYRNCMHSFQHRIEVDSEREDYCQCVGQTVSDMWESGELGVHSQAMSMATSQAWRSCGGGS